MSRKQEPISIIERAPATDVIATLHKELSELEVIDVEIIWSPERLRVLRELRQRGERLPEHIHWNWAIKAAQNSGLLSYQSYGIEAAGKMQGLMMICLDGRFARLDPDKGKPLVYIDYLETAPWNAKEFTSTPVYKLVGLRLTQVAARTSVQEGFSGRMGLHSLSQSTPFYTGACEMQALGPDPNYGKLEYFELTAAKAADLLNK